MAGKKVEKLSESDAYKQLDNLFGGAIRHPNAIEKVDRALTVGGFARGRLIQLGGLESSGKTFLSFLTSAKWQAMDPENCVCFIDAEFTFSNSMAATVGLDLDRVLYIKSNDAVKIFTGLIGGVKKNKVTKELTKTAGLCDMIVNKQILSYENELTGKVCTLNLGKLGVITLDSISNVLPPLEAESDVGKINMSPMARFLSVELRKLTPKIAESNVVFFVINQIRIDLGKMFGDKKTTGSGRALKHACSVICDISPVSGKENKILDQYGEACGHKLSVVISKNKLGPPLKRAEFFINFKKGVVRTAEELLELGIKIGVFKNLTSKTVEIEEGQRFGKKDEAIEYIKHNYDRLEDFVKSFYLTGKSEIFTKEELEGGAITSPFEDDENDEESVDNFEDEE